MIKRAWFTIGVVGLAGLSVLAAPASAANDTWLRSRLTGAAEVPGPGDPDGYGKAYFEIDGTAVCYEMRWSGIGQPTAAHIHRGGAGVAGPVVVNLGGRGLAAGAREAEACVEVAPRVADAIRAHPADFYVNLHTRQYPDGAIRGQLHLD